MGGLRGEIVFERTRKKKQGNRERVSSGAGVLEGI